MESKLKHLELIQGVIDRMSSNSFRLKEWSVVLVSAILFLAAREDADGIAFIGLVPVVVFWGLDAYYLCQERLYRALYDHVRMLDPSEINFSMQTAIFTGRKLTLLSSLFSIPVIAFYLVLGIIVVLVSIIV